MSKKPRMGWVLHLYFLTWARLICISGRILSRRQHLRFCNWLAHVDRQYGHLIGRTFFVIDDHEDPM